MASQINPNNIDGSYPVANQDNNSQGFRDNFTNIKVNFQYADEEITDLQNKAILKSALTGQTLDNDMADALLSAAQILDFSAYKVTVGGTSGSLAINYSQGHYQAISTTGSISLSFSNFPPSGQYGYIKLQINITNTAHTVTLPASVTLGTSGIQGLSAGVITFNSTGVYEFAFGTYDAGATITIFDLNRALTNFTAASLSIGELSVANLTAAGSVISANLACSGPISATGNVVGGNVTTGGLVSATGNVRGANLISTGAISTTGQITGNAVVGYIRPSAGSASQSPLKFTAGTNTSVPTAGSVEYDGTVFYTTLSNNQRGLELVQYLVVSATSFSGNNNTSAQQVFAASTNGALTINASTTYYFEGYYQIAPSINFNATTVQTLFALGDGASLNSLRYTVDSTVGLSTALVAPKRISVTTTSATVVTDASPGGAATNFNLRISGIMRTNAGGTFTPQYQFSATPGSAPQVLLNSWFRITPLGSSGVTTIGPWS